MLKLLASYATTAVVMIALDMVWLGLIARPIYQQGIGALMAERPNVPVAALFYALYALGLMIFVVVPQAQAGWGRALGMAALFGFFAYATYDLTNLATLKGWPYGLSLLDMAWGCVVSAVAASAGRWALLASSAGQGA